jgi:hypothetical protein
MRNAAFIIILIFCMTFGNRCFAQVISTTIAPEIAVVEGNDLFRARYVLRRFFSTERHPNCYRVGFSQFEGELRVDFVPQGPRMVALAPNQVYTGPLRCGRSVAYLLDQNGRIIRRIPVRE